MTKELTRRQSEILQFIVESSRQNGHPPTVAEIQQAFGFASINAANDHLLALKKKGFINRSSKARDLHLNESAIPGVANALLPSLPLIGRIAAGCPALATENIEDHVVVSPELADHATYCLRVQGESMIEAGILDGDIIIVDQQKRPISGDIVVALVGDDATVKYYHPKGERVELRPANATMQTMIFPAVSVQIQGVVVALQRRIK